MLDIEMRVLYRLLVGRPWPRELEDAETKEAHWLHLADAVLTISANKGDR